MKTQGHKNELTETGSNYFPNPQRQLKAVEIKLEKGLEREKLKEEIIKEIQIKKKSNSLAKDKLTFYAETGNISYKNELGKVRTGSKGFAFLHIFNESKNTTFNLNDIKEYCNPLVNNIAHHFRKEKDVNDTIRLLKNKLKVGNSAFFPIEKKGSEDNKNWIWIEK